MPVTRIVEPKGPPRFVRSVVLGRSRALRLPRSSQVNLVLDYSGAGQGHRSLPPCLVAMGLLPWRGDGSAVAGAGCLDGDASGQARRCMKIFRIIVPVS